MADKTIPQVPDDLKEFHKWTENADWSWPMGTVKHMARDLIDRIAKAESERDSLQREVDTLKKYCPFEEENATLRAQMEQIDAENDELLTEINQLYMQLERQQRAVTDEEWNRFASGTSCSSTAQKVCSAIIASRASSPEKEPK